MASIELTGIIKDYGADRAIHGVDLLISDGEFVAFIGPSGCGKSTLLRMIAGLEEISGGSIYIDTRKVNAVEPRDRDVAMVFQDYALYPHMSVAQNIAFGLKMRAVPAIELNQRVIEAAQMLQIEHLLERKPAQLSGGQRQRVAMGRAIVRKPSVFLFDEPLSNLDAKLRVDMRTQIKRLRSLLQTTTVYVTHDQVEALTLADRIVILRDGRIEQQGKPIEIYKAPVNRFVAEFIGSPQMNMLAGVLTERFADDKEFNVAIGTSQLSVGSLEDSTIGNEVWLGIRPEHLLVESGPTLITGQVDLIEQMGSDTMVVCSFENQEFSARIPADMPVNVGQFIDFSVTQDRLHVFSQKSGMRLNVL